MPNSQMYTLPIYTLPQSWTIQCRRAQHIIYNELLNEYI